MSPKLDKSLHQPFYKKPEPMQKHPPHPQPPEEIKLAPPPHHFPPQPLKARGPQFIKSFLIGSLFTVIIGLVLKNFQIRIEVILPVLAPIWVGSISLLYSTSKER